MHALLHTRYRVMHTQRYRMLNHAIYKIYKMEGDTDPNCIMQRTVVNEKYPHIDLIDLMSGCEAHVTQRR